MKRRSRAGNRPTTDGRWLGVVALVLAILGLARPAAAEVRIYSMQSRAAFLAGTLEGISLDSLGTLRLAPDVGPLPAHILAKHYARKHGPDAYYGQR